MRRPSKLPRPVRVTSIKPHFAALHRTFLSLIIGTNGSIPLILHYSIVLAVKSDEVEALQAQCYALAQSDQFAPLLDLVSSTTLLPKDQVVFQKAYCMYRLSRHQEALKLIASVQNPSVHLKHLEAQAVRTLFIKISFSQWLPTLPR